MHPRSPDGDAGEEDEEDHERDREERRGRLGGPFERPSPSRGCYMQEGGQDDTGLRESGEKEKVDQERLPGPQAVPEGHTVREGEGAERPESEQALARAGRHQRAGG